MERAKTFWKWIKVLILAPLAVYLSVMMYAFVEYAWSESCHNFGRACIDPRSLEHLELSYMALHISVIAGLLLCLTIAELVHTLCPSKQPGRIINHLRRYGLYMAPVFAVLFVVFLFSSGSSNITLPYCEIPVNCILSMRLKHITRLQSQHQSHSLLRSSLSYPES